MYAVDLRIRSYMVLEDAVPNRRRCAAAVAA